MQYCPKCKVSIRGNKSCCPLCEGSLDGTPENPAFPTLKKHRFTIAILFRIWLFTLVIVEVVMFTFQALTNFRFHLPEIIMMWAPLVFLDLCIALFYRANILKLSSFQAYVIMLVCIYTDRLNGALSWSINWVVPITLVCHAIAVIVIGAFAGLPMKDYMIYLAIDLVFSLLQLVFIFMGINRTPYAAIISIAAMIIIAAFVVIFRPRDLGNAFSKYMNV